MNTETDKKRERQKSKKERDLVYCATVKVFARTKAVGYRVKCQFLQHTKHLPVTQSMFK